jgi:hypothetical protein
MFGMYFDPKVDKQGKARQLARGQTDRKTNKGGAPNVTRQQSNWT